MPEQPFDPDQMMHEIAKGIAQLRELLAPIDEAVSGYRKQLEESGWSPTVAEAMALEFHRMLMANVTAGTR
jgi:hypothetical protein